MTHVPRYRQIINYYSNLIESGQLRDGDRMPTEEEIGTLFRVSRITVRQALDDLSRAGLIYKMQGRGSFVSSHKTDIGLNHLVGFSEEMRQQGLTPSTRLVQQEIIMPSEQIATALQLEPMQEVLQIVRIRCANEMPMALERAHLPFYRFPGLAHQDLTGSLYTMLREQYGCETSRATQSIQAATATRRDADLLEMKQGEPVLNISRITYGQDGMPFEFVTSVYRGDRYVFNVTLNKQQLGA